FGARVSSLRPLVSSMFGFSSMLATILSSMLSPLLLPILGPRLSPLAPMLLLILSPMVAMMLSSMLGPRLSSLLASMLSSTLSSMLSSALSSMLSSLLASMLSSLLSPLLGPRLSLMLSWMLSWILGPMRRRPQNIGSRRRGPRPPRAERVAHTPDPDRPACTQMHGGQKWFRCANADRQIDQGYRKTLRTHPVLGCWCFRTVPASPTTRRGSRNNLDRDGSKRPVSRLAKISQRLFFRPPPALPGNSPQTFVDHGRAVLRYGLGRTETTWPRRSRSPGASLPFVPGESREARCGRHCQGVPGGQTRSRGGLRKGALGKRKSCC